MSDLKVFSTDGLKINDHAVEPTPATQHMVVLFFLLHYGFFHAAYAAFILSERARPIGRTCCCRARPFSPIICFRMS